MRTNIRSNAKLNSDMRAAILVPYLLATLSHVDAATLRSDVQWISRDLRSHEDVVSALDFEIAVSVSGGQKVGGRRMQDVLVRVSLVLRNDATLLLEWRSMDDDLVAALRHKVAARLRKVLRDSRQPKFRELANREYHWPEVGWLGDATPVELAPHEFGELARVFAGA